MGIGIPGVQVIENGTGPSVRPWFCLGAASLLILSACKLPEQKFAYYPDGCLKERYWVYRENGREVMNGLYTSWFPNGQPEVEILYREGAEVTKTYYSERGFFLGRVDFASVPEP
jgi:antitoxin component YwqK of YwqJK toxin-antitoxin module